MRCIDAEQLIGSLRRSCLTIGVSGGFQRILPHVRKWASQSGFKGIISYADLDTGTGGVYQNSNPNANGINTNINAVVVTNEDTVNQLTYVLALLMY